MSQLAVLITNMALSGRSGTEIQTRNIALELLRQGHKPVVYTPVLGPIATELRDASIPVVTDVNSIAGPIDLVHGHHIPFALIAAARFPECPAIFVCHDFTAWHDAPPMLPSVRRYVAVDATVYDRLTLESGIPKDKACILLNAPDTDRFALGAALPARPRRALAIAKNTGHIPAIEAACAERGIHLDVVGQAVGRTIAAPEHIVGGYDLVFASALSAMEAMATGRAVVVCDGRGLAGMCDASRLAVWRQLNFGLRTLRQPLTREAMGAEIDRYDPMQSADVSTRIRAEGGLAAYVGQLTDLYDKVLEEHRLAPHAASDLSRAIATHLQASNCNSGGSPWLRERALLLERIDQLLYRGTFAPLNTQLGFGKGETRNWWHRVRGFSVAEEWGTWTDGARAIAFFRVGQACEINAEFVVHPFVPDRKREMLVAVTVNGLLLDTWRFHGPDSIEPRKRRVRIPKEVVGDDGAIWLAFAVANARSPKQLGLSGDLRVLGLGLHEVTLRACD